MSQTVISLEETLRHHDGWSEETRLFVRQEMERIGAATFRNDVHGYWNSVKVYDAQGDFLADILKTKVWYAAPVAPAGASETNSWGHLSILLDGVERRSASPRPTPPERQVCQNSNCAEVNQAHAGECW